MEKLAGNKDQAGMAASEGTFQHHVAALCLENKRAAESYIGYQEKVDGIDFTFDEEHARTVQVYLDTVWGHVGDTGELFIEQGLDISSITGEPDAIGTADAIVVRHGELIVIDLKTGRNNVEAFGNHQLIIYALAALKAYNEGKLVGAIHIDNTAADLF
jgi:hypothetical protein